MLEIFSRPRGSTIHHGLQETIHPLPLQRGSLSDERTTGAYCLLRQCDWAMKAMKAAKAGAETPIT